jgi:hypothetical protein
MTGKNKTSVELKKSTKAVLIKLKIHPRQSYDEVITNLIIKGAKKK